MGTNPYDIGQFRSERLLMFPARLPMSPEEIPQWAQSIQNVIQNQIYELLATRMQEYITVGDLADRPSPDGTLRFYFAQDESPPVMYFDDGSWHALNAT